MGILKKFKRKKRREREAKERLFYPQMEEPENTVVNIVENNEQSEIADTVNDQIINVSTEEISKNPSTEKIEQVDVEEQINQSNVEENQKIQINEQNNEINIEDNVQVSDAIDMEEKKS